MSAYQARARSNSTSFRLPLDHKPQRLAERLTAEGVAKDRGLIAEVFDERLDKGGIKRVLGYHDKPYQISDGSVTQGQIPFSGTAS